MSSSKVVYDDDHRYPRPTAHTPPGHITGITTQSELDAQARMFTWGELKEIVRESSLSRAGSSTSYQRYKKMGMDQSDAVQSQGT